MKGSGEGLSWKARLVVLGALLMLLSGFIPIGVMLPGGIDKAYAADGYEPNESFAYAYVLPGPGSYEGLISDISDDDYFRFSVPDGYALEVTLTSIPLSCDYDIELYDESEGYIAGSFAGENADERIFVGDPAPGDYFVNIYSWSGSSDTDTYVLDISLQEVGAISGTVTSASEPTGVADVWATAYIYDDEWGWESVASAYTGSGGTYEITGLETGTYRVRFNPPEGTLYVSEYYQNKQSLESANDVPVTAGITTENIDATLEEGGKISGTVTSAAEPDGVWNVGVYVYDQDWNQVAYDYTDEYGYYETSSAIPTGNYKVRFYPPWDSNYVGEWYDDKPDFYSADDVEVTEGSTTSGIDAVLGEGGKIAGTVTSAAEPGGVEGVLIYVYLWDETGWGWTYVDSNNTASDGTYEVGGLEAGIYLVAFIPPLDSFYMREYYNDKRSLESANNVYVELGQTTSAIDAILEEGGKISGTVTSATEPGGVQGVDVLVYDQDLNQVASGWTDGYGYYETEAMPPGDYKVVFNPWESVYMEEWYQSKLSFGSADWVSVMAGATTADIDAVLDVAGSISGRVTGALNPGGVPYVLVSLYSVDDPLDPVTSTMTSSQDGAYRIQQVPAGNYKVLFQQYYYEYYYGEYASEWYEDKRDFSSADIVTINPGEETTGIDAVLERNGSISGRVMGEVHPEGIPGMTVAAYDGDENLCGTGWTDSEGRYEIFLEPGLYHVSFSPPYDSAYGAEWYDDKPDFGSADTVEVFLELETPDIDAYLVTGAISGTVISPDEPGGIANVDVFVYDADGYFMGSAVTSPDGSFRVNGLPTGDYHVYAYPWWPNANAGRSYVYEWYQNKGAIEEANPVPVTAGVEIVNIDFELESGSISGTVTGWDNPGGLEGVSVYVHDQHFHLVGTAVTASDGAYTVKGIRSGDYRVYFDPTAIRENEGRDYIGEYYEDKDSFFDADPVSVASDVASIDAVLEASGTISGTVSSGGSGVGGVFVHAYHASDPTYWVGFTETEPDGSYTIGGLAPGDYKVSFNHASGQNYLDEWYNNKADPYSADVITLTRGGSGATGVNAELTTGGSISGTVTGSDAPDGLAGVQVRILDGDYAFKGGTLTAPDGTYTVGGLPTGTHYVEFFTGEPGSEDGLNYQSEFFNERLDWDEADPVAVTAGSDTFLEDAELQHYGSISGKVTGSDHGEGMEGLEVVLYDSGGWWRKGSTITDASGSYSFESLGGGDYTVYFNSDNFNSVNDTEYASEWYDDKAQTSLAEIVIVTWGADTSGIDAILERNGRITGRVTSATSPQGVGNCNFYIIDASGNYIFGGFTGSEGYYSISAKPGTYKVQFTSYSVDKWYDDKYSLENADPVTVGEGQTVTDIDCYFPGTGSISGKITSDTEPDGTQWGYVRVYRSSNPFSSASAETDSEGNYVVENLPAGDYKILFEYNSGSYLANKWYDGKGSSASADIITVAEGAETKSINAHFTSEISISGRVTSETKPDGVSNLAVYAYSQDDLMDYLGWVRTSSDGTYDIKGLAPGDYLVRFGDWWSPDEYLTQWYSGKPDSTSADPVTVAAGIPATGIDAVLVRGGSISGKVTSDDNPDGLGDVSVVVYDQDYNDWGWYQTDYEGNYQIRDLPAGEYKLYFSYWYDYSEYMPEWYDDKPDFASADFVTVTASADTPGKNAHLTKYGSISGTVTSATEPGGVGGVHAYLYEADNPDSWLAMSTTDPGGAYTFERLRPGDYKVVFSPISGMNYAEEWYEGQPDFESADVITLSSGQSRIDIDTELQTGGSIAGRVTSKSKPGGVEGVGVTAYTPDGEYARACHTDENGYYTLSSLTTGDYVIEFNPGQLPYKGEWYQDKYDRAAAVLIPVTTGVVTTDINAELDDSGSISGRVTSDTEPDGVRDIYVYAYLEGNWWNCASYAVTRGDGTYVIEGLAPGRYKIIFNYYSDQGYESTWYDSKAGFDKADAVGVDERVNTGNINCHFAINTYTISASADPAAGGTVSGAGDYGNGQTVNLSASANAGYTFTNWTEGAVVVSTSANYSFTATADRTLVAHFAINTYTISASADPAAGGTVSGAGDYGNGQTVNLSASANAGYTFTNWTEGAVVVSTSANYSFTATADRTLVAHFAINTYTISASVVGGNGQVSPATQQVAWGGTATIDLIPDEGYHVGSITDNGADKEAADPYVISGVQANHNVVVTFDTDEPPPHPATSTWYLAEGCTEGGMETWVLVQNPGNAPVSANLILQTSSGEQRPAGLQGQEIPAGSRRSFNIGEYWTDWNVSTKVVATGEVICERAMYGPGRVWAHDSVGVTTPADTWYLAEGCTEGGMETWVLVQNPGNAPVSANLILQTSSGEQRPAGLQGQEIPAGSRRSFNIGEYWTDWNVSTKVVATGEVICERAMYGPGRVWAHDSVGVTTPADTWYLAEGCTEGGMETWVLVQNPGNAPVSANLILQTSSGEQRPAGLQGQEIPAGSRRSFNIGEYWTDWNVSTKVVATGEVICERAMYGPGRVWAHDSVGVTTPADTWYLAEGCTEGGMETWVLVQNPGNAPVSANLILQTSSGEQRPAGLQGQEIPAGSRRSFNIGEYWTDWNVSTKVVATGEVICERAMYGPGRVWAHDSVGCSKD